MEPPRLPRLARRRHLAAGMAVLALAAAACGSTATSTGPSSTAPTSTPSTSTASTSTSSGSGAYGASSSTTGSSAVSASAATVSLAQSSKVGQKILVGSNGHTLYLFEKDTSGKSTCSGACTSVWPPLTTSGKPTAGSGLTASLVGTITGSGGVTQVTYNGHPLYSYVSDTTSGQANGQGLNQFGALWYAVSAQGTAVTGGASAYGGSGSY